ncbi:hypothetical protein [Micromonospora sp. NPDC093277]|uniref:hypothetical protein n=1 Tax=Micromonospora sp. NPDC093277 TaxID=3364291 RepID=UPI0037F4A15E
MNAEELDSPLLRTRTKLNIHDVMRSGWLRPEDLPRDDVAAAEQLYADIHRDDQRLFEIRAAFIDDIERLTGATASDIGSFGLGLNLAASDLDLGVAWPRDRRHELRDLLEPAFTHLGDRQTRFANVRTVFSAAREGIEVDLTVLCQQDYDMARGMHAAIADQMLLAEKIAFTWVKSLLHEAGLKKEYNRWKSAPYHRFCPEFAPSPEGS